MHLAAEASSVCVQYGCGLCAPDGWLNFDATPTARLQRLPLLGALGRRLGPVFPRSVRYGDIVRGLPLADGSCDLVYCSHVLEHLSLEDCRRALANTHRILRRGGRFRLVMPDLRHLAEQYVAGNGPLAAIGFLREMLLGQERRPRGLASFVRSWIGNSAHRWLWDYGSIEQELRVVGFTDIRRAQFADSGDERFSVVEDRGRWVDALGVDCRRPA